MSSIIPVESVGRPLYASDRAVHWAEDVAYALNALNPPPQNANSVQLDEEDDGVRVIHADVAPNFKPQVFKVVVGPLIAVIAFDKDANRQHAVLQNYFQPGGFGALLVGATSGKISQSGGIVSPFSYASSFGGSTTVDTVINGSTNYLRLNWNFTNGSDTYVSSKLVTPI